MNKIKVKANSARGKQLIKQFGDSWEVLEVRKSVAFSPNQNGWFFAFPIGCASPIRESRWIAINNDKHLDIC
jgi:hypothetical protein